MRCTGSETSLSFCSHRGWGRHYCGHGEDAGVNCQGEYYFVDMLFKQVGTLKPHLKVVIFPIACVPACVRGTCTEDRVCVCPEGWTGEVCNIPGMNIKCHYNSHIQFHGPRKGVNSGPHITLCTLLCSL